MTTDLLVSLSGCCSVFLLPSLSYSHFHCRSLLDILVSFSLCRAPLKYPALFSLFLKGCLLSIPYPSLTLFLYVSVLLFCFGCWVANLENLFLSRDLQLHYLFFSSVTSSWSEIMGGGAPEV
jgi:hypothetical protein